MALECAILTGLLCRRSPDRRALLAVGLTALAGWSFGDVGAIVQGLRIAVHPTWFDHNALYHVIQMAALLLVSLAGRHLVAASAAPGK